MFNLQFAGNSLCMLDAVWLILHAVQVDSFFPACVRPCKQTLCMVQHLPAPDNTTGLLSQLTSGSLLQPVAASIVLLHSYLLSPSCVAQCCTCIYWLSSFCIRGGAVGLQIVGHCYETLMCKLFWEAMFCQSSGCCMLRWQQLLLCWPGTSALLPVTPRSASAALCCILLALVGLLGQIGCLCISSVSPYSYCSGSMLVDSCLLQMLLHARSFVQEGVLLCLFVHGTIAVMLYLQLRCHAQTVMQQQALLDEVLSYWLVA